MRAAATPQGCTGDTGECGGSIISNPLGDPVFTAVCFSGFEREHIYIYRHI